ncbi:MAG: hypothetical protein P1R58_04565 [bacterium]|nr:hypothetical protein [bacterium]
MSIRTLMLLSPHPFGSLVGLVVLTILLAAPVLSEEMAASDSLTRYEGQVIDSIRIENRNIYDTKNPKYSGFLFKSVNRLHLKTKAAVVRRELLFKTGDNVDTDLIRESARNLRRRLALFDAWIEIEKTESGKLLVRVVTIDQWSLATGLTIKKVGKETDYKFYIEEKNLFGNNQVMAFDYVSERREDDDSFSSNRDVDYFNGRFSDTRFLGSSQALSLSYSGNPSNKVTAIGVGMPYYDFTQNWRYELLLSDQRGRRDFYQDETLVAEADYAADGFSVGISRRFGPYMRKLRFNLTYQYIYAQSLGQRELPHIHRTVVFPDDSSYHAVGLSMRASKFDFVELRKIDGVGYTEDFITGTTGLIGLQRANDPDFNSYRYDKLTVELARQWYTRGHLISVQLSDSHWFKGGSNIRDLVNIEFGFYNNGLDFLTFALNGRYLSNWYPDGREDLNIGGTTGVRGYDTFYRSGNRRAVLNFESRFFPNVEILSAVLGGVIFLDAGRVWRQDEEIDLNDFLISGGVGLRIHLARLGRDRVIRVDFGYSESNTWQILIGTNQYFRAALSSLTLTNL